MHEDNTPVIIGTGQLVDRDASLEHFIEPLEMLTRVARLAEEDTGADHILSKLDTLAVVGVAGWQPQNPVDLLAGKLGAKPKRLLTTGIGGQVGITLLNHLASNILRGESEIGLVVGCNNLKVLRKAIAAKKKLDWEMGGQGIAELLDGDQPGSNDLEGSYGLQQPPDIYPLFENALRARLGIDIDSHSRSIGQLFSGFTDVAAANPYAWFPVQRSAEELISVSSKNRMIAFPYPKYLNAVLDTEQAAGLIICSVSKARSLGISQDRWVYWLGGSNSEEKAWWVSERPRFDQCPSMKDAHLSTLNNAATGVDEVNFFDFYSCFPVAVEMACDMLGLKVTDTRGFTVTGGLPYAGGPASAYTLHSLAEMTAKIREHSSSKGLVTGNGWYLTKHSSCILAASPADKELIPAGLVEELPSAQMETEALQVNQSAVGKGTIEAYTVLYNREGDPVRGIVLGKTLSGNRFLANTPSDKAFLSSFVGAERVGNRGEVSIRGDQYLFNL